MKSLWVKNHWGKIGVDGMLAFVPPFSGIVITCVFFLNEAYTHRVPMSHVCSLYKFTSDPSCSCIGVSLVLILQVSTPAVWCGAASSDLAGQPRWHTVALRTLGGQNLD